MTHNTRFFQLKTQRSLKRRRTVQERKKTRWVAAESGQQTTFSEKDPRAVLGQGRLLFIEGIYRSDFPEVILSKMPLLITSRVLPVPHFTAGWAPAAGGPACSPGSPIKPSCTSCSTMGGATEGGQVMCMDKCVLSAWRNVIYDGSSPLIPESVSGFPLFPISISSTVKMKRFDHLLIGTRHQSRIYVVELTALHGGLTPSRILRLSVAIAQRWMFQNVLFISVLQAIVAESEQILLPL